MYMIIHCSGCGTALQLPPGAPAITCAICRAVTQVSQTRGSHSEPSPYNHAPPGPPPNAHGRKRALVVGISYKGMRGELQGCINDAKCMRYLLISKFRFPEDCILMLTEEETDRYRIPTKENMRMAMHWLVQGCQPGDSLLFHYSGHGHNQRDLDGDERDGTDETLCPLDFNTNGMIVDDEINATLVRPLPPGVKLHALIDACHSGTALDLPYLCKLRRNGIYEWEDHRPLSGVWKGTSGGEAISFSGCRDDQTSADTTALSKVASTGAMTFCFIQALERGEGATYGSILNSMRAAIRSVGGGSSSDSHGNPLASLLGNTPAAAGALNRLFGGRGSGSGGGGGMSSLIGRGAAGALTHILGGRGGDHGGGNRGGMTSTLIGMLANGGSIHRGMLNQEPQLTSNEMFDVYAKPFSL